VWGEPQSQSGRGEEEHIFPLPIIEFRQLEIKKNKNKELGGNLKCKEELNRERLCPECLK
jgi:hypothetical protein